MEREEDEEREEVVVRVWVLASWRALEGRMHRRRCRRREREGDKGTGRQRLEEKAREGPRPAFMSGDPEKAVRMVGWNWGVGCAAKAHTA